MSRRLAVCALPALCLSLCTGARRLGAAEPARPADPPGAVRMAIADVRIDPANLTPVVILQTVAKDRYLVILIGHAEALAIASQLAGGPPPPRPMTHDLLLNTVKRLGGTLTRVVITRLADNTFHAELVVQQGRAIVRIDARSSDAMALALRAKAPVLVARDVLKKAGVPPDELPEGLRPEPKPPRKPKPKDEQII